MAVRESKICITRTAHRKALLTCCGSEPDLNEAEVLIPPWSASSSCTERVLESMHVRHFSVHLRRKMPFHRLTKKALFTLTTPQFSVKALAASSCLDLFVRSLGRRRSRLLPPLRAACAAIGDVRGARAFFGREAYDVVSGSGTDLLGTALAEGVLRGARRGVTIRRDDRVAEGA